MGLHRLTSITLGVPDVVAATTFFTEFGLASSDDGWLSTRDGGAQLELVPSSRRRLARLGLGATEPDDLGRFEAAVAATGLGSVLESGPDRLLLAEPVTGLPVEITVAPPYAPQVDPVAVNRPGKRERIDVPAASVLTDGPVVPSNLTHVVYVSPDQPTTLRFFTDVLGFEISDEVPGIIAFTRCSDLHHNLALQAGPVAYPHHIAFEMDEIDDVVRGGQRMVDADPERHTWGVGRHAIGSNWFWYLREPNGTFVEYAADIDRISAQDRYRPKEWVAHEFLSSFGPPTPQAFLQPADLPEIIAAGA
jgi:catechol 2,3-dioxygenase-like lactoylglutathione lyase family enzyme